MATVQGTLSDTRFIGIRIDYSEKSYDIATNKSVVHVNGYIISTNNGAGENGSATSFVITVDGQKHTISVPAWTIVKGEVWKIGEHDFIIEHDNDGKKTVSISATYNSNSTLGTGKLSASLKLTDIPRKSTLGTIPTFTFDSNENVGIPFNVPVTKNYSSYYNVLNISVQNEKFEWIPVTTKNDFNGGNITFTVEELQILYAAMFKLQSTFFKFELITYENSNKAKIIGTDTKENIRGNISMTGIDPTLDLNSVIYEDTNLKTYAITGNKNIFIKNYSDIKITFNEKGIANKGATLGDNSHAAQVKTVNGTITKSLNYSDTFPASLEFEKIADKQVDVFVFDSRNIRFPAHNVLQTVTMWEYVESSFNLEDCKVYRTNGVEASSFISLSGTYHVFEEKPQANTITKAIIKYKEKNSYSEYTEIDITSYLVLDNGTFKLENYSLGDLDVASEFEFIVEIEDMLSKTELTNLVLNSAKPYIWHQKNKKVMGIGGKPKDGLKEGSLHIHGDLIVDGDGAGSITIRKWKGVQ